MANSSKALQLILFALLFLYIKYVFGDDVLGTTYSGQVKGKNLMTRNGRNISAFLGIPYAEPPVGRHRFEAPVAVEPWDDIRVADTDRDQCPQLYNHSVVGNEDCLYMNIFTREVLTPHTEYLSPTMVYFHGGHFVRGNASSTMCGPEYLLDKDIVLVTVQYRLGVLGFMSTGDRNAPGNFGLKDQVLALKWLQDNIVFFGGDPDKVTIFGQGAGGVSAQLHSISDASKGLFHQYISQSGTSLCLWAYVDPEDCEDDVVRLGKHLNCPTANYKDLVDCLRKVDVESLVDSNDIFGDMTYRFKTWGPTEEPEHSGAFLSMFPYYKVSLDGSHIHRSIIGHVADEGLMLTAPYYSDNGVYEKVANNLNAYIQHILDNLFNFKAKEVYVEKTKEFYFNETKPGDKEIFTKAMTNLISDTFFLHPADAMAHMIIDVSNATVYCYSFEYEGTFSKTSRATGSNESIGVTHGDDLTYLFPSPEGFEPSESDEEMSDTMIDLWTSFAHTGIPSSKRFPDSNYWKPYGYDRKYLKIGNNTDTSLSRHDNFDWKALDFLGEQELDATLGSYFRNVIGIA